MNPAGLKLIEACSEQEAIGCSVFDLVRPAHRAAFMSMHRDVINGQSRTLQFEIQGFKGGRKWLESAAVPFRNPVSGCTEHLAVSHDITERKQADMVLRTSEEKLRQALHASLTGLWDWNTETNEVSFSKEWKGQLGYEAWEIQDSFESWASRLHPDDRDRTMTYVQSYLASPSGEYRQEFRLRHKDGSDRWIEAHASLVAEPDGRRVRLLGSHTDITERKQAEQALQESERRFRLVAEATNDVLWDWDLTTNQHWWSPDASERFGYDPAVEPSIDAWSSRLHPDDRDAVLESLEQCMSATDSSWCGEYRFRLADGSYGYFMDRGHIVRDAGGKPIRMIGAMIDVTEPKRAYAELDETYRRLQAISNQLQTVEANERRRLSRELHDEFGQLLTGLKYDLQSVHRGIAAQTPSSIQRAGERALRALETTDLLFARLRRIVRALRPPVLDELGLNDALQALASDLQAHTGILCSAAIEGPELRPGAEPVIETALYRIAQELLTNVARHSGATEASVVLTILADGCRLVIRDNGAGFQPTATPPTDAMGLRGVRERAEIVGGEVAVCSAPGEGTAIAVRIPFVRSGLRTARRQ